MGERERLPIETFDIPVQDIRRGYYSAVYFWREKQILEKMGYTKNVLMQVFQKNNAVLCGIDEAIAVLRLCSGYYREPERAYHFFDEYKEQERLIRELHMQRNYSVLKNAFETKIELEMALEDLWVDTSSELEIRALNDCDRISPWETVMTIKGLPQYFAHLESVYLGILARRTLVATNVANVVEAANGKPILFFADRFDHYRNQTGDGYAAMCGGVKGVATNNMGEWWGNQGSGTMPHALIACFNGNTVNATLAFAKQYPEVPSISLVDFHNECVATSLDVARAFKGEGLKLWGVRLDTSENMVDASIYRQGQMGEVKPTGVNPLLVNNVRRALDHGGFDDVKIIVSGGFNREKIEYFEEENVPVDAYGCGSSLLKGSNDFTADIVEVDGRRSCGKVGRWYRPNNRLQYV
jgi:nicotinate phosphoribosyltransferase